MTTRTKKRAGGKEAASGERYEPDDDDKLRQQRIEGTFDPVPEEVQDKVDSYVAALRKRMKFQKEEDTLRSEVIDLMKEHKLERVPLDDDDEKQLVLEHGADKIKIKKRKEATSEE